MRKLAARVLPPARVGAGGKLSAHRHCFVKSCLRREPVPVHDHRLSVGRREHRRRRLHRDARRRPAALAASPEPAPKRRMRMTTRCSTTPLPTTQSPIAQDARSLSFRSVRM